jgi:hypothetical protein
MPKEPKPAAGTVSVVFQSDVIVGDDDAIQCALPPGHYVAGSIWPLSPAAAEDAIAHRWATLAPEQP